MLYRLKQVHCRPWLLLGLSQKLPGGHSGWKAAGGPVKMQA